MKILAKIKLRIVAQIFFGIIFLFLAFKSFDKSNNSLSNLMWRSQKSTSLIPYTFQNAVVGFPKGLYTFTGKLSVESVASAKIYLRIDDCLKGLKVNQKSVDIPQVFNRSPICYGDGFKLADFSRFVVEGENEISFLIENNGGGVSVQSRSLDSNLNRILQFLLLYVGFMLFCNLILLKLKFSKLDCIIFYISSAGLIAYAMLTGWDQRTYDVHGHLQYLVKLLSDFRFFKTAECWECSQQPTYYLILLGVYKSIQKLFVSPFTVLQLFQFIQVAFGLGFFFSTRLFLTELGGKYQSLSYLLITTWLTGVIHFTRIGNDAPWYFFASLCWLYILKWWNSKNTSSYICAAIFAVMALGFKLTALYLVVSLALLTVLVIYRNISDKSFETNFEIQNKTLIKCLIFLTLATSFVYYLKPIMSGDNFLQVNHPTENMRVTNNLSDYIGFSPNKFFSTSAAAPFNVNSGRNLFLNMLSKSFLHGEFGAQNSFNKELSTVQDIFFFVLAFLLLYLFLINKFWHMNSIGFPLMLLFFSSLLILAAFRFRYPFSSNQDFRYVYPLILGLGIVSYSKNKAVNYFFFSFALIHILFVWTFVFSGVY